MKKLGYWVRVKKVENMYPASKPMPIFQNLCIRVYKEV